MTRTLNQNKTFSLSKDLSFEMIFVQGGQYQMGSSDNDSEAHEEEKPQHPVELSSFHMGKFPVTQDIWRAVALAVPEFGLPENPSRFKGEQRPVETVSWEDIDQRFLPALNKLTGQNFRLPTEAEWEYAARGGIYHEEAYLFAGSDKLSEVGWYDENSGNETKAVGQRYSNQLGLYDMSGNVWEWCRDWFDEQFYQKCLNKGMVKDPCCTEQAEYRVLRGGGFFGVARDCHVAIRGTIRPDDRFESIGFRLAL